MLKDTVRRMGFRRRLLVSLLLLLVVPVGATALLATRLASDSKTSQADARIGGALPAVVDLYRHEQARARRTAAAIASSPRFAAALKAGRGQQTLDAIARERGLRSVTFTRPGGVSLTSGEPGVAGGSADVVAGSGAPSRVTVSTIGPRAFVVRAEQITGLRLALQTGGQAVESRSLRGASVDLSGGNSRGEVVRAGGQDLRARVVSLPNGSGPAVRLALIVPRGASVLAGQGLELAGVLAVFLVLAALLLVPLFRDLQGLHDKVEQEAITDELTGLANRRAFAERFGKELSRSRRFGHDLSLLLLDLDDFKKINDTYGHSCGDAVLKHVAAQVRAESRVSDEPARYGGEEFVVALPETPPAGAAHQAERLRKRIAETPCETEAGEMRVTASIGIAGASEHDFNAAVLFEAADAALYSAKRAGKNRVVQAPSREPASASPQGGARKLATTGVEADRRRESA